MAAENPVVFAEIGNPKRVTQLTENTSTANAYFLTEKAGEPEAKKTAYSTVERAVNAKVQSEYLKTLSPTPSETKTMSEKLEVAEFKKRDDKIAQLEQVVTVDDPTYPISTALRDCKIDVLNEISFENIHIPYYTKDDQVLRVVIGIWQSGTWYDHVTITIAAPYKNEYLEYSNSTSKATYCMLLNATLLPNKSSTSNGYYISRKCVNMEYTPSIPMLFNKIESIKNRISDMESDVFLGNIGGFASLSRDILNASFKAIEINSFEFKEDSYYSIAESSYNGTTLSFSIYEMLPSGAWGKFVKFTTKDSGITIIQNGIDYATVNTSLIPIHSYSGMGYTMTGLSENCFQKGFFDSINIYKESKNIAKLNEHTIDKNITNVILEKDASKYIGNQEFQSNEAYGQWYKVDNGSVLSKIIAHAHYSEGISVKAYLRDSFNIDPLSNNGELLIAKNLNAADFKNSFVELDINNVTIKSGQYIFVFFYNTVVRFMDFYFSTPQPDFEPFIWKAGESFGLSSAGADHAYYQIPLKLYSQNDILERVENLEKTASTSIYNVSLPSKLYAAVGVEFNLYFDGFMLFPEHYTPLIQLKCDIGNIDDKRFYVTPTQAGNYAFELSVMDNDGRIKYTHTSELIVKSAKPTTVKKIAVIGDSTTDDTADVLLSLADNIKNNITSNKPVFVGSKVYFNKAEIKHDANTGQTFGYYAYGGSGYKLTITGLPASGIANYPNWTFKFPDGSGYFVAYNVFINGTTAEAYVSEWATGSQSLNGYIGVLKRHGAQSNMPDTVTVTNSSIINGYSVLRKSGSLDFGAYTTLIGSDIDILSIDLGINDCRGYVRDITSVFDAAKTIINSFLTYSPSGKVLLCLPKSNSKTNSMTHDDMRLNIFALRNAMIGEYDNSSNVILSTSGMSIDRFYGYPQKSVNVSARIPGSIMVNADDVHPNSNGYAQVSDVMFGAISFLL